MNIRCVFATSASLLLLIGYGCAANPSDSQSNRAESGLDGLERLEPEPEPEDIDATAAAGADETRLISAEQIGLARLGMTFAELKQALGNEVDYTVETNFIVDFDAIAVRQDGEVQFYILYLAGETFTDEDVIQGLMTDNPAYQTAAGVGPGTPISVAEAAYGDATLSYNLANESREYVRFANQPTSNISFGTYGGGASTDTRLGVYPTSEAEYNETTDYVEDAAIQTVLVVCLSESCV